MVNEYRKIDLSGAAAALSHSPSPAPDQGDRHRPHLWRVHEQDKEELRSPAETQLDLTNLGSLFHRLPLTTPAVNSLPTQETSPARDFYRTLEDYFNERGKRGALELALMMKCASPRCDPVDYKGYGCYCGFMGAGVATDGIDM